jgi:hypothetical protein
MSSASPTTLPPDIADYLRQLNDADQRAENLLGSLTDASSNWQPNNGAGWSVAQCVAHMAATNTTYLSAMETASADARSGHVTLEPAGWFSRYFLRKTEPPVSVKIKAPRAIRPGTQISKSEALNRFKQSNEEVRKFVLNSAGLDLCSVRFRNPFVPLLRFTVATGLLVIAAHNRRHLWQAEQVVKKREFPR